MFSYMGLVFVFSFLNSMSVHYKTAMTSETLDRLIDISHGQPTFIISASVEATISISLDSAYRVRKA